MRTCGRKIRADERSRHTLPKLAELYLGYHVLGHAEHFGKLTLELCATRATNVADLIWGKFGAAIVSAFAAGIATAFLSVAHVVGMGPGSKVSKVATLPIVATMQNIGLSRERAVMYYIHRPVSAHLPTAKENCPVASGIESAHPIPALLGFSLVDQGEYFFRGHG